MAASIFSLYGEIFVENQDAISKITQTENKGKGLASKLGSAFKSVGVAIAGVATAAGAAFVSLTKDALNAAGELEQNVGGSEQVFKQYAEQMQATASTAFSKMGLSASDFLATANKMGALFQGSGFTVEESANLSAEAMQRAADVASIMGIDVGSAMEAVAGAAKGNFTMMDNLGVSMNATSLEAYRLEKGMTTAYNKMSQQEKVALAMEMFMEKTAYATGNYAKENETLSGSLNTAKAAFSNFLAGTGSAKDVVSSLTNATKVVGKNLMEIIPSLAEGLIEIGTQLLPEVIPIASSLINEFGTAIITNLPQLLDAAIALVGAIGEFVFDNLPLLTDTAVEIILEFAQGISEALPQLIPAIVELMIQITTTLLENVELLTEAATQLITGLAIGLIQALPVLIQAAPELIVALFGAIVEGVGQIMSAGIELMDGLLTGIKNGFASLMTSMSGFVTTYIIQPIKNKFGEFQSIGRQVIDNMLQGLKSAWENVKNWFNNAWNSLFANRNVNVGASVNGYATGLDYVPYDEFPAFLHEGEAVLTKEEANRWRAGELDGGGSGNGGIVINQYIETVPQTPVDFADATAAYFEQARWALS